MFKCNSYKLIIPENTFFSLILKCKFVTLRCRSIKSNYPLQIHLGIGIKRNIKGQKSSKRKCVTSTNLLKFENGGQVTYLASYRKLHSKW